MKQFFTGNDKRQTLFPSEEKDRRFLRAIPGLCAGIVLALVFVGLSFTETFQRLELKTVDWRFSTRGGQGGSESPVVVVSLDETTIDRFGWPVSRNLYSAVIGIISQAGARAIGIDAWFSHQSKMEPDADLRLMETIRLAGNVYLAAGTTPFLEIDDGDPTERLSENPATGREIPRQVWDPSVKQLIPPFAGLLEAARGLGVVASKPDPDGVFRRVPLVVHVDETVVPNLSLALAAEYFGDETEIITRSSRKIALKPREGEPIEIRMDRSGFGIVNFSTSTLHHPQYSFLDVIEMRSGNETAGRTETAEDVFRDKVVIIGSETQGGMDMVPTPLSPLYPGHWIWADLTENLIRGKLIQPADTRVTLSVTLLLGVLCGTSLLYFRYRRALVLSVLLLFCFVAGSFIVFSQTGILVEITPALLTVFSSVLLLLPIRHYLDTTRLLGRVTAIRDYSNLVMESMDNVLLAVGRDGIITRTNRPALAFLGTDNAEGTDIHIALSSCPPLLDLIRKDLVECRERAFREIRLVSDVTDDRWLNVATAPIHGENGMRIGLLCLIDDVTEVRRLRETSSLKERLTALGEMSARLAHEVGNSAQAITTYFGNIKEELNLGNGNGNPIIRRTVSGLDAEIDNISGWARDLKEYSRPVQCRKERLGFHRLLSESAKSALSVEPETVTERLKVIPPEADSVVWVDRRLLSSSLVNLMRNALEAIPDDGSVVLRGSIDYGKNRLIILVEDTGSGIPETIREKIFQPFFSTKGEGGTGLGLAIARKNIELQDGSLTLACGPTDGSVFRIELPFRSNPDKPAFDPEPDSTW